LSTGGGASTADILFPETDAWMMEIRYSPNSGANIAGPSEELLAIKKRILGLARVGVGRIELSGNSTGSPAPYDRWLKRLIISAGNGPIIALVGANREFNITANPECLKVLASFFSVPEGAQPAWHTHVQFYPGNQWISEDSEPTVISLREPLD
jgi:hypothetical protein